MPDNTVYKKLTEELARLGCAAETDSPMSRHTSFKTGGNARLVVLPESEEALRLAAEKIRGLELPMLVLGNGTNVLVRDCGYDGVVLKTGGMASQISVCGDSLSCGAGVSLKKLCTAALEHSLTGLEFAYGIPGTVGGAVFMNAGAYGGEMKDALTSVTHMTPECRIETVGANELRLGYRTSFYSENPDYIILRAEFKLSPGDKDEIKSLMDSLMQKRKDKQPLEFPSAGSTFKRPEGHFAGALIEQCGLKGFSIGGASVSEKHAGFIINKSKATSGDVLSLMKYVADVVREQTGVMLEPEVKIIP